MSCGGIRIDGLNNFNVKPRQIPIKLALNAAGQTSCRRRTDRAEQQPATHRFPESQLRTVFVKLFEAKRIQEFSQAWVI